MLATIANAAGWIGWLIVGLFIAGFDIGLEHIKHTTLSDTWLAGAHNKALRPLEAAAFASLGSHLFYGTSIYPVMGSCFALAAAVLISGSKRKIL